MADRVWYFANGGNRQGPVSEDDLHARIASGEIKADTLVWNSGMADWAKAGAVGLMGPGAPAVPPGAPALPSTMTGDGVDGMPLVAQMPTWPLFGRTLLAIIGQFLIIPAPWTTTSFYRWFFQRIDLPNHKRVTFDGQPGDIWWVLMLNGALAYIGFVHQVLPIVLLPVSALVLFLIIRWILTKLRWEGQGESLRFTGSYWGLLGWMALTYVSFITIIGWAWVQTATLRWLCRYFEGSSQQLTFVGSGWGVLWRSLVFVLSCVFIIPIPWTGAWYTRWYVSQFHLGPRQV